MPRNALLVARGRIFGEGCPNLECHAPTGFRANRRERTSGPDEGGGSAKQKDGVCPTTLDRAIALTKRRSSPSSNRVGQVRPFPTSARRPAVAGQTVRDNKPEQISLLFLVNFYSLDRAQTEKYKPTIIRYFPKRLCSRSPP